MLAGKAQAAAAVTGHLVNQADHGRARMIMHGNVGREITGQTGRIDTMVELNVLAGVESLVEVTDPFEHGSPVRNRDAAGFDKALRGRIDVRTRVVAEPAAACGGDCLLDRRSPGNLQRLWPPEAI